MSTTKSRSRKSKTRTTHGIMDITTPLAGLFRLLDKGEDRMASTKAVTRHGGFEITYTSAWRLGADDWQVFVVLCALAGLGGAIHNAQSKRYPELWGGFGAVGETSQKDALRFSTSAYTIMKELGRSQGGKGHEMLVESLVRLASVQQTLRQGKKTASGSNLIAFTSDLETGEMVIAVSPRMAEAILSEARQYVKISLVEMRALNSDAAIMIHAYLSGRIRPGSVMRYKLDLLAEKIYAPKEELSPATIRKRRQRIRESLLHMNDCTSWKVSIDANNVATIQRAGEGDLKRWEQNHELEGVAVPKAIAAVKVPLDAPEALEALEAA